MGMETGCLRDNNGLVGWGDGSLGPRFRGDDGEVAEMMGWGLLATYVYGKWAVFMAITGWWVVETGAWVPAFAGMTERWRR